MREVFQVTEMSMKKSVDHLHEDLKTLRTGRASLSHVQVDTVVA